ncbi:uncharacterized protein BDZ99DRAFT_416440 [Mytilinidion resinicola]|uniref:RapZ C-terminal domain-containing protein n=1 Tax=Mytilinidion resinicola TaxID=574789 RepID=A0A6A6YNR3_9PEZI|nr:uncharacterized protein BDZ99DRAFT_416440 [Mytilinidion resinicola]KAF2810223.1 hypothetical protein BDZ99DRAFT_416440 [Mytilinidion resinicola]
MATTSTLPPNSALASNIKRTAGPPLLIIYSHGRTPPLNPPPDLKFDLRTIPNPPKSARDTHDGRSKRMRAHLLADARFTRKLEEVKGEIEVAMQGKSEAISGEPRAGHEANGHDGDLTIAGSSDEELESPVLRVGCNCALGHHRSVAFVEELARLEWPGDWRVQIVHRDVDKKRASGARAQQKGQWRVAKQESRLGGGHDEGW